MKRITFTLVAMVIAAIAFAQTPVVLPETATIEDYTLTGKNYYYPGDETMYEDLNETVKVAFDNDDVYIQGLCGYLPDAWVKGTRNGDEVTFANAQLYDYFVYDNTTYPLYFCGYNGSLCDVVFQYNEEYGIFVTNEWILTNEGVDELNAWHYLTEVMLFRGAAEPQDELVTPPANLQSAPYIFTGTRIVYSEEGFEYTEIARDITLGFADSDIYVKGLCEQLPEAWVKGSLSGDEATFPTGQFYGEYSDEDGDWRLYFAGILAGEQEPSDLTFDYDPADGSFTSTRYMLLNSTRSTFAPFEQYAAVKFVRSTNAIETANSNDAIKVTYTDILGRPISNPSAAKGIVIMTTTSANGAKESKKIMK